MALTSLVPILSDKCGLAGNQTVLVGVSGGPDSLALLYALKALGRPLLVGHYDHGVRPASAEDAAYVGRLAEEWGLPFFTQRGDAAAHAQAEGLSLEEAARELRYRFLFDVAQREGAAAVVVAHTADDQAETVLMHLLRGAGLDGLSGMPWRNLPNPWSMEIALLRPLLDTWRSEVEAYCAEQGLQPLVDESNQDTSYFRNRLRHELLPLLADYNPQAKAHLAQTARLLEADRALIEQLTAKAWARLALDMGPNYLQLDRLGLLAEPLSLQRNLLRRAFAALRPGARDLGLAAVEAALEVAQDETSSQVNWLDGLYLLAEGASLWIADWAAELPMPWPQLPVERLHFEVPGSLALGSGWQLEAREAGDLTAATQNQDGYQAWLDWEVLGGQLILRRRQPGDRFQPLGMADGSLKLADYMVNAKLPQRARAAWPLLCKGDEVVWLPGYQIAHTYRLQAGERPALHLRLQRASN